MTGAHYTGVSGHALNYNSHGAFGGISRMSMQLDYSASYMNLCYMLCLLHGVYKSFISPPFSCVFESGCPLHESQRASPCPLTCAKSFSVSPCKLVPACGLPRPHPQGPGQGHAPQPCRQLPRSPSGALLAVAPQASPSSMRLRALSQAWSFWPCQRIFLSCRSELFTFTRKASFFVSVYTTPPR